MPWDFCSGVPTMQQPPPEIAAVPPHSPRLLQHDGFAAGARDFDGCGNSRAAAANDDNISLQI